MKSELSLRIVPELSDLTKAIDKITKDTSEGLSKAIDTPLNKLKDRLKMELNIGKTIAGPKLPKSSLKEMGKQIREATNVKLGLDLKEANAKIDSMRYQVLGAFAGFKGLVEKPIKVAMEFETAMSDVKKVVDFESASELKNFEKEIWKLTRTIPLAAKDLTSIVASGGELVATQAQNAQNFYNSTQSRQINDNKTIYINTTASANEVAQVIASNSYAYAD